MNLLAAVNSTTTVVFKAAAYLWVCVGLAQMVLGVYRYMTFGVTAKAMAGIATAPFSFGVGLFLLGATRANVNWFSFKRRQSFLTVGGLLTAEVGFLTSGAMLAVAYLGTRDHVAFNGLCLVSGAACGLFINIMQVRRRTVQLAAPSEEPASPARR